MKKLENDRGFTLVETLMAVLIMVMVAGITASGTEIFDGVGFYPAEATGGSSVSPSSYTGGGGGPGGGPGGGGHGGW